MKLEAFNMIATEHITRVLEESLYMSERIFNDLPIISVLCDDSGSIMRLNHLAHDFFKLTPQSKPLGCKIWEFFTGESRAYFEDFFSRKSLNSDFIGKESFLDVTNSEEYIFWQTHCAKRGSKQPSIWTIMGTNTRELRRTYEAEIFSLARRNSIMNLSAGIAHEFNNPLTILLSLMRRIGLACDGNVEAEKLIEKANFHLDRISRFVGKFKRFGYDSEDNWEKVNVNSAVTSAIDLIRGDLEKNEILLKLDLEPAMVEIYGNHHGLVEMLLAIAANSKDALRGVDRKDRSIEISTRVKGKEMVHISIWDNGCGIDERNLERVFDPFFTTKSIGKGEGLGLTLAYSVVRSHNGVIHISSKKDEHTRVDILLPIKRDHNLFNIDMSVIHNG